MFDELFKQVQDRQKAEGVPFLGNRAEAAAVEARKYALLMERHNFHPGDLVEWKPGLKNRRWPAEGQPVVVLEVLTEPVIHRSDEPSTNRFREPLDLILAFTDTDGDFDQYVYDSRRFQPFQADATAAD